MNKPDEHAARILSFVQEYQRREHRSPTYREIGAAVGIPSSDHVARDLRKLARDGFISLEPQTYRSIVVLKSGFKPSEKITRCSARHKIEWMPGHCVRCGIRSRTKECTECATPQPLIQYHFLLGADRFGCQNGAQLMAGFESKAERNRRCYHSKVRRTRRAKQHA